LARSFFETVSARPEQRSAARSRLGRRATTAARRVGQRIAGDCGAENLRRDPSEISDEEENLSLLGQEEKIRADAPLSLAFCGDCSSAFFAASASPADLIDFRADRLCSRRGRSHARALLLALMHYEREREKNHIGIPKSLSHLRCADFS
jgi:hypothetical protein